MVWSVALTEPAAGGAAPGCLNRASHTESCPLVNWFSHWLAIVPYKDFWSLFSTAPPTADCWKVDSNSLKLRQSDNESVGHHWQQLLNSQNQWKVWEGTWWRMLVFPLLSTQLSTPHFTDTHTSTHTHACSYHLLSVILQGSNVFYTNIVYTTPLLCLFHTDQSWHVTNQERNYTFTF